MKLVVLNHKMNFTYEGIKLYIRSLKKISTNNIKLVVCPSNLYISDFIDNDFYTGSQNVSNYDNGSYTGEISASQLQSIGVKYCIIGHSERKQYFNESNKDINNKLKQLLKHNIIPILCVGETLQDKDNGVANDVITKQIMEATKGINIRELEDIIISYEPVWAIGCGIIPSTRYIEEKIALIKQCVYDIGLVDTKILYGGSVNDNNIEVLKQIDDLDGYLIGGLGLDINKLSNLIKVL